MDKKYLTPKEYAQIKNCSTQYVYKIMKTKLAPFVETVDNKKCLKIEVLQLKVDNHSTIVDNQVDNQVEHFEEIKEDSELQRINRRNEIIIDELRKQLAEKDEQIKNQSEHIVQLSTKITELFENNQKLQLNYQYLLSNGTEQQEQQQEKQQYAEEYYQDARAEKVYEEIPKQRSFFKRLFNIK